MTIMTKEEVGAWCKEIADQINSDPILLDVFTRAYCTEEEEPMSTREEHIIADIDAQMLSNPELITPADEAQLNRIEELLVNVECNTHPNAPHGFLRNASHNEGRYVCECEHWKENT
jgi:hypothetical protein